MIKRDFVRKEIGTAISQGVPVIPLLIEGAKVPSADSLPEDLRLISEQQGARIHHENFWGDIERVLPDIRGYLRKSIFWRLVIIGVVIGLIALVVLVRTNNFSLP
jgi:hypothetical protein